MDTRAPMGGDYSRTPSTVFPVVSIANNAFQYAYDAHRRNVFERVDEALGIFAFYNSRTW